MTRHILLVQLGDIGDLVTTTPAIAALREAHPQAHLTLLAASHTVPVIQNGGLVDQIVTIDRKDANSSIAFFKPRNLRRLFGVGRHDTIIYFRHFTLRLGTIKFALMALACRAYTRIGLQNGNGWFLTEHIPDGGFGHPHEAEQWLNLVGLLGADTAPRPMQVNIGQNPLAGHPRPYAVIHPGSGGYSPARRWDAVKFAQVAASLTEDVVLVGGVDDNTHAVRAAMSKTPIDLTGQTTLPDLAALIRDAELYIGADSGVMHIASAVGAPVVAVFGPSNHAAWGPYTPNSPSTVLRSGVECSPCSYVGHGIGLRDGCAARTCMRLVTSDEVLAAARDLQANPEIYREAQQAPVSQPPTWARRIHMLDLPVDAITYDEWLALIDKWVQAGERLHHVCTTNPEFMMIAQHDPNFRHILHRADLCVPDGVGLLLAARYLGEKLPQRVTGSDGVPIIAARAAERGWKLFFLGAAPGIADQAAEILKAQHPGLQIVGTHSGSPAPEEEDAIVEMVNHSGADILFVAYGAPRQDKWIARNSPRLNVAMAMGVGGAFDFIAGEIPRAPMWMRRAGLEWLYRLYLQPSRIGRMTRLPRFVWAVLRRG